MAYRYTSSGTFVYSFFFIIKCLYTFKMKLFLCTFIYIFEVLTAASLLTEKY